MGFDASVDESGEDRGHVLGAIGCRDERKSVSI